MGSASSNTGDENADQLLILPSPAQYTALFAQRRRVNSERPQTLVQVDRDSGLTRKRSSSYSSDGFHRDDLTESWEELTERGGGSVSSSFKPEIESSDVRWLEVDQRKLSVEISGGPDSPKIVSTTSKKTATSKKMENDENPVLGSGDINKNSPAKVRALDGASLHGHLNGTGNSMESCGFSVYSESGQYATDDHSVMSSTGSDHVFFKENARVEASSTIDPDKFYNFFAPVISANNDNSMSQHLSQAENTVSKTYVKKLTPCEGIHSCDVKHPSSGMFSVQHPEKPFGSLNPNLTSTSSEAQLHSSPHSQLFHNDSGEFHLHDSISQTVNDSMESHGFNSHTPECSMNSQSQLRSETTKSPEANLDDLNALVHAEESAVVTPTRNWDRPKKVEEEEDALVHPETSANQILNVSNNVPHDASDETHIKLPIQTEGQSQTKTSMHPLLSVTSPPTKISAETKISQNVEDTGVRENNNSATTSPVALAGHNMSRGNQPEGDADIAGDCHNMSRGNQPEGDADIADDCHNMSRGNQPEGDADIVDDCHNMSRGNQPEGDADIANDCHTMSRGNQPEGDADIANDWPLPPAPPANHPQPHRVPVIGQDEAGGEAMHQFLQPDPNMLSLADRPGYRAQYAAYLLVADKDFNDFGLPFLNILNSWGLQIFFPERDLCLTGDFYENTAAVVETRCNGKVIVVLSKNYPQSKQCQFVTSFVKTLDPDAKKRNIIPVSIDKEIRDLPRIINGLSVIRYNQVCRQGWLKEIMFCALNLSPTNNTL